MVVPGGGCFLVNKVPLLLVWDMPCGNPQKVLRGGIPCSFLEPFVRFCGEISSKVNKPN